MKRIIGVLVIGLFLGAGEAGESAAKSDKDKLQGTWHVVSAERMGMAMPNAQDQKLVIQGDTLTVKTGEKALFKGKIKLDPSKKPATLDMEVSEGRGERYKGKVSQGIYLIEGDVFKWCNSEPGVKDRPNEFATNGQKNHMLLVLKREKK